MIIGKRGKEGKGEREERAVYLISSTDELDFEKLGRGMRDR